MASVTTFRSPLSAPQGNSSHQPDTSVHFPSTSCSFRRSRSRVFYDSEYTSGTSWEFRGIDSPSYYTQMHLSVLRSPQVLHNNSNNARLNCSPLPIMIANTSSSSVNHRSIPSPPTKDDLSDGSRNSTGSSTGSHRSQDSGFSDSGEVRPPRNSLAIASASPHPQHISNSPCVQLHHNQIMATSGSCNINGINSNLIVGNCGGVEASKSYVSPNGSVACRYNLSNQNATYTTFVRDINHPHRYQEVQPIYSPGGSSYAHEQQQIYYSSNPVPSPITGSGCGKLMTIHRNGSTFTLPPRNSHSDPHIVTQGEINGNGAVGTDSCSNCIYQEIVLSKHQVESLMQSSSNCNSSQQYHHHLGQNRSTGGQSGNYALYCTISPSIEAEQNGRLGAPICASTPKRSNLSISNTSSRLSVMNKIDNKIDNFESLNKNQRALDTNNNSNNSNSSSNVSSSTLAVSNQVKISPKNLNYQFSSELSPSSQPGNASASSSNSHQEKSNKSSKSSKKHSKQSLSLSSISQKSKSPHNSSTSSSTILDSSKNKNKTVVQRGPLPLPPVAPTPPPSTTTPTTHVQNNNNNSFTPNEFSTYASHSQLKSCIKIRPEWKNLSKYKTRDSECSYSEASQGQVTFLDGRIAEKSNFDNDAMRLWLHELRSQTENECFYMLQTKSIISEEDISPNGDKGQHITTTVTSDSDSGTYGSQESGSSAPEENNKKGKSGKSVVEAIHNISAPLMSIKNVEEMANVVSAEFAKICKNIEFGFLSQVPRLVLNLVSYVEEFLRTFQGTSMFGNLQKLENKLSRSCRRLQRSAQLMMEISGSSAQYKHPTSVHSIIESENMKKGEGYHVAVSEVVDGIVTVGNLFSQVVDLRLTRDLTCILETVEGGGVPAKVALKSFANILMDGGNHLCRLASEIRTVRGMLSVILDAKDDYLRILSLRCLATILCVGEAVKDFDRASGFEIVADFMYEPMYSFDLKIEAVSVLTQATDPWIDLETSLSTLGSNLDKIVVALTNLIPECASSEEPFLLVVAAISNLTFLEVSSVKILRRCNTISFIINVIENAGCNFSVFVLDHVATILANMAGVESCRDCIVKSGGIHALLNFLHKRPTPTLESAAEIMACERVQQKSTIAISRLCSEEGVAKLIMERGGLHRLIQLSRNEKERNYSDGVLIAALATLRKLVTICGDESIRDLQADDLIQPRLLDSFLLYSSRQESYV